MNSIHILKRSLRNVQHVITRRPAILLTNILLTKKCTQRCLHCSIPVNATGADVMSVENFKRIADRLESHGTQMITLSGGDPMLHPHLEECIEYAVSKRFARVHLLTTLYGSDKMVNRTIQTVLRTGISISISFDGFGEIADTLRGGKDVAEITMRSIEHFDRENKKRTRPVPSGVNIVINRMNLHQIPDILDYLETYGWSTDVDIYRWASTNQRENDLLKLSDCEELRSVLERVKRSPIVFTPHWLIDGFSDYLSGRSPKWCPYMDSPSLGSKFYIDPDGSVKACIGDTFGNLLTQTAREIFQSDEWKRRLKDIRNCSGCWNTCYTTSARILHPHIIGDLVKTLRIATHQTKRPVEV